MTTKRTLYGLDGKPITSDADLAQNYVEAVSRMAYFRNRAYTNERSGLLRALTMDEFVIPELHRRDHSGELYPVAVALSDARLLRERNNQYGHEAGNRMIARIGKVFQEQTRSTDVLEQLGESLAKCEVDGVPIQYGGDEFVTVAPTTVHGMGALMHRVNVGIIEEDIREAPDESRPADAHTWLNTGIVFVPEGKKITECFATVEDMLQRADQMMYIAKAASKSDQLPGHLQKHVMYYYNLDRREAVPIIFESGFHTPTAEELRQFARRSG